MDNLHNKLTSYLGKKNEIFGYSYRKTIITRIAKFGGKML